MSDSPAARLQVLFEGHRLTPTQRRIAHCMVRRAADVPFLSSVELADLAGVSQPSVTRFAVALGFDGYPALRRHLRELAPAEAAGEASLNEYQQAVEAEIANLRHLAEVLADPAPVERAGRLLASSRP
ncbi:MAG: MurR/RpiR family transcriptional regulator, partial [Streptomyces sp.]